LAAIRDQASDTWAKWSEHLAPAYIKHASAPGNVRFQLVTRALAALPLPRVYRIVDIGGGFGMQAVMLARLGHAVTVLDPDPLMLAAAAEKIELESPVVRARISLIKGNGEDARRLVGDGFDLVCCHSVLMYLGDPGSMIKELADLARPDGWISILALNGDAIAMRSGLQRKWREALASMQAGQQAGSLYLPSRADTVEDIERRLALAGAQMKCWYGVGVFTDHVAESLEADDFSQVCELEWQAGLRDPYRKVARIFHAIAQKVSTE
jgi:S-adenosylmethionine-dependent methyltransferase